MARFKKISQPFFLRSASEVALALIGKILVRRIGAMRYRARIVETEAYHGPIDLASHASKGLTKRTRVLFGPPGLAYVYIIYGIHPMLNIVVGTIGDGHAVLIRAAEPLDGWPANLSGPGKLATALGISLADNGASFTGPNLFLQTDDLAPAPQIQTSPRIGIDYAQHWKDAPLRFFDANSRAVSRRRG
jgi:DNA-3-methyladenine glycosylase